MKKFKNYSWYLNKEKILEIYITDLQDNEFIVATLVECDNMQDFELDNIAQETLENLEYELI